ncbi:MULTISPECIES: DUF2782 domain-containing protein [unclassified Zymobacter]|uniref:DUF2782 domain-containing protein n=1 Tax=unclassified Zymobacter TaxID=3048685 RepID=UPI0039C2C523
MQHTQSGRRFARLALGLVVTAAVPGLTTVAAHADDKPAATQAQQQTPDITTRQEKDQTIEEYRIHGKLYAIKITPSRGEPYMLVDHSGDGNFQMERNLRIAIPEWTLLRW